MHDDPRIDLLRRAFRTRTAGIVERHAQREAAVALLIRPRESLELLLIKRSERANDPWSGQMALPGGRRAAEDADLLATALRETEEETAVPAARIGAYLGPLDEVEPRSHRLPSIVVAPFVLAVPPHTGAQPNPLEVDAAIWVPLDALRTEEAIGELIFELESTRRVFPSLRYGEHVIWGLTHRILSQFIDVATACGL